MGLEQNNEQQYREVVDKYVNPTVNYQMTTRDYVVRPAAAQGGGPIIITLPPVAEAKGRFYSIIARDADNTNTITIADKDDSECWEADIELNGKCDSELLYSDGLAWIRVASVTRGTGSTTVPPTTLAATTLAATTAAP
jgi:hypothetical protein